MNANLLISEYLLAKLWLEKSDDKVVISNHDQRRCLDIAE